MGKIYNISASQSLVDVLAERFFEQYKDMPEKFSEVLFLLPSRRACRNLQEAFVRQNGRSPTILPRIKAILDIEEDEVYLSDNPDTALGLEPPVPPFYRTLVFTKQILQKQKEWGLGNISSAQAFALAENLGNLTDLVRENDLGFENIEKIVQEEYAEHWQKILKLLSLITLDWPRHLKNNNYCDEIDRKIRLLRKELEIWRQNPPCGKIVVAGTTAGFPVIKELIKTVSGLQNGEVYLYGLDKYLDDKSWDKIDENHPQFELKELLEELQLKRADINELEELQIDAKQRFVSEIMRPAETTSEWQNIVHNKFLQKDLEYLQILNCDDSRQEAYAISLIMREVLETPEKTAALVTPDRNLARRVVSELKRWNIIADDSSGRPLHLSPLGLYLRLIINVLEQDYSQVSLLALLKHPFCRCSLPADKFKIAIYQLERHWRNDKKMPAVSKETEELLHHVHECLKPLHDLYFAPTLNFSEMLETHIKVAEKLADTDIKTGDKIIWRKEDGAAMAKFVAEFIKQAQILGNIPSNDYGNLFTSILSGQTVRPRYGYHPRLKILGPIESRLQNFDVTIIGGVNEGIWPQLPQADMWMSRPMKREFGLPMPERSIGISAADFAHLLHGKQVYITRCEKDNGTPTSKSRWLLRLETVLAANYADYPEKEIPKVCSFIYDKKFIAWAKNFERASFTEIQQNKLQPPAPKPPFKARPRKLYATKFEEWMNNPYNIFARFILNLYRLDDLDKTYNSADYGNFVHEILFRFNNNHNSSEYPSAEKAKAELIKIADELFYQKQIPVETATFWRPKINKAFDWIIAKETEHRPSISKIHNEVSGETTYEAAKGPFTLAARADRIEETVDKKLNVIDYKTGGAPTKKAVTTGFAPQLSIEAMIAENGGFDGIAKAEAALLSYWKLSDKPVDIEDEKAQQAIEAAGKRIKELIDYFDDENTPYYSYPNSGNPGKNDPYEHLSRFLEWSIKDFENSSQNED